MNYMSACDEIEKHGYGAVILSEERLYSNLYPQDIYDACLSCAKYLALYEEDEVYLEKGIFIAGTLCLKKRLMESIDVESVCPSSPFIACCKDDFGIACFVKTTNIEDAVYHLIKGLSLIEETQGPVGSMPLMN